MESVFDVPARVFPPDSDSFDERPNGESALAAFLRRGASADRLRGVVDLRLSDGRVLHSGPETPGWLSGFDPACNEFSADYEDLVVADEDDG